MVWHELIWVRDRQEEISYFAACRGNSRTNSAVYFFMASDGSMGIMDGASRIYATTYVANQWYRLSFFLNWSAKTVDYYVNGVLVSAGTPFRDITLTSFSRLALYNFDNTQNWWDQIEFLQNPGSVPVTINPAMTGTFTNGVWSGAITVPQPATNLVLSASDGAGHFGSSNPFNVAESLPRLQIAAEGNRAILSWPASATGYTLETTTILGTNSAWSSLTNGVAISGGSWRSTNVIAAGTAFFRLRKP